MILLGFKKKTLMVCWNVKKRKKKERESIIRLKCVRKININKIISA